MEREKEYRILPGKPFGRQVHDEIDQRIELTLGCVYSLGV